jgi:hypothetical protein
MKRDDQRGKRGIGAPSDGVRRVVCLRGSAPFMGCKACAGDVLMERLQSCAIYKGFQ